MHVPGVCAMQVEAVKRVLQYLSMSAQSNQGPTCWPSSGICRAGRTRQAAVLPLLCTHAGLCQASDDMLQGSAERCAC